MCNKSLHFRNISQLLEAHSEKFMYLMNLGENTSNRVAPQKENGDGVRLNMQIRRLTQTVLI